MYHILFIHSSVDEHLDCIHVFNTVNSASVNTGVYISFQIIVFYRYILGVGLLDHIVVLCLACGVFLFCF